MTLFSPFLSRRTTIVLAVSGLAGFYAGLVREPMWQDAIEPAQVLAGVVTYPADNPVYLYSTRVWTLLHQIVAVLLSWGMTERTAALLLSGAMGMVSFQALGLIVLALSEDVWLASLAPFFIYLVDPASDGVGYPAWFAGAPFTYGVFGLSLSVMIFALFGAGESRAGMLVLGLLPAVHLTLGAWCFIVVAAAAVIDFRSWREALWTGRWWLAAGLALTGISAAVQFGVFAAPLPRIDSTETSRYLDAVFRYWDVHRRPIHWTSDVVLLCFSTTALALVAWWRLRAGLPRSATLLLQALVATMAIGSALSLALAAAPPMSLDLLRAAMPSRLLNVVLFASLALIVGIAGGRRSSYWFQGVLVAIVVLFAIARPNDDVPSAIDAYNTLRATDFALIILAIAMSWRRQPADRAASTAQRFVPGMLRLASLAVMLALTVVVCVDAATKFKSKRDALVDRTRDPLYGLAARRTGLLLTGSHLHRIQLVTRRPVLLDGGALDGLAYIPQAGPATDRIMREVYGISFLDPGFDPATTTSALPDDAGRALWESRTLADWQAIRAKFGVTDVLTFFDWKLQLPQLRSSEGLVLWWIPE